MLTIVLTRHGLTEITNPEIYIGQRIDVSLRADGRRQAEALARRLAHVPFDAVISSPLFRAQETAEIVGRGAVVRTDPRLREMDYGGWEGHAHADIERDDPALRRRWDEDPETVACPGGESGAQVAERARSFLAGLLAEHKAWHAKVSFRMATSTAGAAEEPGQTALVVGHSSLDRVLLCVALGIPVRDYRRRLLIDHCSLTVLRWTAGAAPGEAQLLVANDTTHLRAARDLPWG
ncbi:MAG: histidine phosphatase family protein [Chloroflexota bacterium]